MKVYRLILMSALCSSIISIPLTEPAYGAYSHQTLRSSIAGNRVQIFDQSIFLRNHTVTVGNSVTPVLLKTAHSVDDPLKSHPTPRRDDPFDDWIGYDDGEPLSLTEAENYWSRVSYTTEYQFTLQGILFMPINPGFNDEAPCRILVYLEDQDTHDLDNLLWETELEELQVWDDDDIDENWHFIEIPEDEWIDFEEGEHFSIVYGPAPGGEYMGLYPYDFSEDFEDFDTGEPPSGGGWSSEQGGRSYVEVSDEDAHSDDQSVRFHDPRDMDGDYCMLLLEHDEVVNGRVEFWLKLVSDGDFGFRAYSNEFDMQILAQFEDNHRILSNNGANLVWADGEWEEDEWLHIEVVFGTDDNSFSIWLDGELIVDQNGLLNDDPVNKLLWIAFGNTSVEDVYLDDVCLDLDTEENDDYGWWNFYDEDTEVERSYIFDGMEIDTDHDEWDLLEGDLLLRANGDYRLPAIALNTEEIDFGSVLVDESEVRVLQVSNEGDADLVISGVEIQGQFFTTDFEEEARVEPESQIEVTVTFAPEEAGESQGNLTVISNDPENEEVAVSLIGYGNHAPVISNEIDDVEVNEDPGRVDITDLDGIFSDPDDDELVFEVEGAPEPMNMAIDDDFNILFFDPDPHFNIPDGIEIAVSAVDQPHGASVRLTFQLVINAIPDPPEIVQPIEDVVVREDPDPRRVNIADLDEVFSDPDGDILSFEISENVPAELHLEMNQWNLLFFAPEDNFNTPDGAEVTITADDGTGLSADMVFNLMVTPVNDLPTPFNLLTPEDGTCRADPEEIEFTWQTSVDEVEDSTVAYAMVLNWLGEDHWIRGISVNSESVSRQDLAVDPNQATEVEWWVWAYDGIDSIRCGQAFHVTVAPLSAQSDANSLLPTELALTRMYPNPFNNVISIGFDLPESSEVLLAIYDQMGGLVKALVNRRMNAGCYSVTWDGRNFYGNRVSSGSYICCLQAPNGSRVGQVILLK